MMLEEFQGRLDVCIVARSWLRTPFRHHQRLKGCGVDCGGFIAAVYEEAGVLPHIELPEYTRDWFLHCKKSDSTLYSDVLDRHMVRTEKPDLGDTIGMSYGVCKVAHAGIIISDDWMIAASALDRTVCLVERRHLLEITTGYWTPKSWAS